MKRMLIFWEMRDSSMSFTPILPKTSHHTIHKAYFQEHNSLYPEPCAPYLNINVTHVSSSEEPSRVHYAI